MRRGAPYKVVSNSEPRSRAEGEKALKEEGIEKVTRQIMAVMSRGEQSVVNQESADKTAAGKAEGEELMLMSADKGCLEPQTEQLQGADREQMGAREPGRDYIYSYPRTKFCFAHRARRNWLGRDAHRGKKEGQ